MFCIPVVHLLRLLMCAASNSPINNGNSVLLPEHQHPFGHNRTRKRPEYLINVDGNVLGFVYGTISFLEAGGGDWND